MRYGLRFRPATTSPDASIGVKMRKTKAGKSGIIGVEVPAPCVSLIAGYAIAGDVLVAPGQGANTVYFECTADPCDFKATAVGVFCPDDSFDWEIVVSDSGGDVSTIDPGTTDLSGRPTITQVTTGGPCGDPSYVVTLQLRKNAVAWGPVVTAKVFVDGGPCAAMASMPAGFTTYAPNAASDVHFDITLLTGFETLTPGDITWTFTQIFGPPVTPPTITADGPDVSDGFTIHTDPALDGGGEAYYGTGWTIGFTVLGTPNCDTLAHYSDSALVQFNALAAINAVASGSTESVLGDTYDTHYTVTSGADFDIELEAYLPSVGSLPPGSWSWSIVSGTGDPDYLVSDIGASGDLHLQGTYIGGADRIVINATFTDSTYGVTIPKVFTPIVIESV